MTPPLIRDEPTLHPLWLREIHESLPANPQFIVTGNIRDIHLLPGPVRLDELSTLEALWWRLKPSGYEFIWVYNPVDHLTIYPRPTDSKESTDSERPTVKVIKKLLESMGESGFELLPDGSSVNFNDRPVSPGDFP